MACEHFSWDHRNTDRLIEQWSSKPCLYDPSCVDYRDKAKREIAMAEIAAELGTIDSDIRDKMKTLRSQYSRERTHEDKSQSDAERMPGRTPYKSKWMYFARLSFLDEHKRRPRRDDRDVDGEASERANRLLAAAMEECAAHDRLPSTVGGGGDPPERGGEHSNGLAADAAESLDADNADEAELMIDADALSSRDSLAARPRSSFAHAADDRAAAVELPWTAAAVANGSWQRHAAAPPRHQRPSLLLHASAETRYRYGDARPRSSRDAAARRRESNAAWRAAALSLSRPAAAVLGAAAAAERSVQPPPPLRSHRPQQTTAAAAAAIAAADSPPPCSNGGLDVDLVLRLAEAAAARAVAAGYSRQVESEDAESAFGRFIARQLRLLTRGHERQLARLRIHQAMVDALAAADDPSPVASGGNGGGRS